MMMWWWSWWWWQYDVNGDDDDNDNNCSCNDDREGVKYIRLIDKLLFCFSLREVGN